ncbi:unnamed protein product [Plutella xylostella]|uniref:(diamondback moth) hypothetical protein n=1 Tax=Plutella xylostella TaxID=51655 RepID=A0A8S4FSJ0_PLUXY|nr:unnamed protein product [Plutella xylostella]
MSPCGHRPATSQCPSRHQQLCEGDQPNTSALSLISSTHLAAGYVGSAPENRRNLYWTDDALGSISVARLDNSSLRRTLVREPGFNPRAIALDPANGMMYWSVWAGATGSRARLEAADMAGGGRRTLVAERLHWPNGLVIDLEKQHLYWCDTYLDKIERVELVGGARRVVLRDSPAAPLLKPYGLALYDGTYWRCHRHILQQIQRAVLRDAPAAPLLKPYGLALYDGTYWRCHRHILQQIQRAVLRDAPAAPLLKPYGLALYDGTYWRCHRHILQQIQRAVLRDAPAAPLLKPYGLALYDGTYWRCHRHILQQIQRAVLRDAPAAPLLKPYGLALYDGTYWRCHRHILQQIQRAVLRDAPAAPLLKPYGLALYDGTYWRCHRHILQQIQRAVLRDAPAAPLLKPYGLALYDGMVIWSELGTGSIRALTNATNVKLLRELPPPLYDLKLVTVTAQTGQNQCSVNNGGCAELCLATPGGRQCACSDGRAPAAAAPTTCVVAPGPTSKCEPNKFYCKKGGRCIELSLLCDGDADCPDREDEDDSPHGPCANVTCRAEQFKCDNSCFPRSWLCDGYRDCADGVDEASCSGAAGAGAEACAAAQWRCAGGRCVPAAWRCDGAADCPPGDNSDEADCEKAVCSAEMFVCAGGACVPRQYTCDGAADCPDASDELHCPPRSDMVNQTEARPALLCEEHEFQCTNGECIRKEFRCDSRVDCLDGSDETACNGTAPAPPAAPAPAPCAAPALQCDAGRCVPLDRLCDGTQDCDDGKDEADRCGEPMCDLAPCSHTCHPSPSGPVCGCPVPLALQADGATCSKHEPCKEWGICSQKCEPYKNRHKCSCYEDYKLADDGFTCKSTLPDVPLLVFSNRHELRGVPLGGGNAGGGGAGGGGNSPGAGGGSRALVSALKNTVAVDWDTDPVSGNISLYWTDVLDDHIYRGQLLNGVLSNIEVVVQTGLATAEGLAVDWVAHNIYWVESSLHQIEVARWDGAYRRTLVAGDMDSPRAVAADPTVGYLFWTDWEQSAPRIERVSLAGRGRRRLLHVAALAAGAWPNGLSLDHRARRLYWLDARSDSIHTTTYEGTDYHEVLRGHADLSHPFALCVFESRVYWTDWRSNSVVTANKFNGSDVRVVQRTLTQPFDIKVIHPSRQPRAAHNPCGVNNGNCSHLCLIHSATERVCACPHVMRLASDDITCEGKLSTTDLCLIHSATERVCACPHVMRLASDDITCEGKLSTTDLCLIHSATERVCACPHVMRLASDDITCEGKLSTTDLCLIHSATERVCACPHVMRLASDDITCEGKLSTTDLCLIHSATERVCACPHVMRLASDDITCEGKLSTTDLCLIHSATERVCACPHVMRLASDDITCEVHEKVLLIGRLGEIRGVELSDPAVLTIPVRGGAGVAAPGNLQAHHASYTIYWSDTETNEIKMTGLTSGPVRTVFDAGVEAPRGFALDWAGGVLYHSSARRRADTLHAANLQGEYSTVVFDEGSGLSNVSSLAVHPFRGKLYWAHSPGGHEVLESAACDGTDRKILVTRDSDVHLAKVTS